MKEAAINKDEQIFSPGMRVKIRDAEWFVRQVSPVKTGGQALYIRGITCPVQGRDQIFWAEAERDADGRIAIEVILPENTVLSLDTSSHVARTRLRIESVVRHNPVSCGSIALAHHAAMDVLNYQLQPAYHALNSERDPRSRILIASDVASEGINLHYFSHRLIHFDILWPLITFQQRNGRIDRYDQNGRCVFSVKSGESYLSRKEWEVIKDMPSGEFKKTITETVFSDTPTERTIVYKAPFFKKCREDDYHEAWEMLKKRG